MFDLLLYRHNKRYIILLFVCLLLFLFFPPTMATTKTALDRVSRTRFVKVKTI